MDINQVVDVAIEIRSAALARAAFNVPLLAANHSLWPEMVREFGSLEELVAAGGVSTTAVYQMASALLAQQPRLSKFKVGKLTGVRTVVKRITPTVTAPGFVQTLSVRRPGGAKVTVTHANRANETTASLSTALSAAILASPASQFLTAADNATHVTVTPTTAGTILGVSDLSPGLRSVDLTVDPGITANLDALRAADKNWYGLILDTHGRAENLAAAAWAESKTILFGAGTGDTDVYDPSSTTDVMAALQAATYHRSYALFSLDPLRYSAAAWMGRMFAKIPGAASWQDKELAGIDKDNLSDAQVSAIRAKRGNFYTDVAGLGATFEGWASSGRYLDITHGVDSLTAAMGEDLYVWKHSQDKVDYDEDGISASKGVVRKTLLSFARRPRNFIIESSIDIQAPALAEVNPTDRSNRLLNQISWTAEAKGAIHKFQIRGSIAA